jgi:hypothetical protein
MRERFDFHVDYDYGGRLSARSGLHQSGGQRGDPFEDRHGERFRDGRYRIAGVYISANGSVFSNAMGHTAWLATLELNDGVCETNVVRAYAVDTLGYTSLTGEVTIVVKNKLLASDGASSDNFGGSVAVSSDGITFVVGASGDDDEGDSIGSIYVYEWNGTSMHETKIVSSDEVAYDLFGREVSISGDGTTFAVGAFYDDDKGSESGSVWIY